mmetsp:Transcript_7212/g.10746  ORF Transcript_7212/g.10746 Transcript_7212/m.10746 type:complete len:123 (-) Transcript_7212:1277-1645(-)
MITEGAAFGWPSTLVIIFKAKHVESKRDLTRRNLEGGLKPSICEERIMERARDRESVESKRDLTPRDLEERAQAKYAKSAYWREREIREGLDFAIDDESIVVHIPLLRNHQRWLESSRISRI